MTWITWLRAFVYGAGKHREEIRGLVDYFTYWACLSCGIIIVLLGWRSSCGLLKNSTQETNSQLNSRQLFQYMLYKSSRQDLNEAPCTSRCKSLSKGSKGVQVVTRSTPAAPVLIRRATRCVLLNNRRSKILLGSALHVAISRYVGISRYVTYLSSFGSYVIVIFRIEN